MSIVIQLPHLGPSSVVDQKIHGMVTYIQGGGRQQEKSVGGNTDGCVGVCLQTLNIIVG